MSGPHTHRIFDMYDYLIVGAGLFGAAFARKMTDAGKKCLVIDRRPHIGGNAYTETVEGINVHRYGAHIFHTDSDEVWNFVRRFAHFNSFVNSPVAYYKGGYYPLPFNMNTFQAMWGVTDPEDARAIIEQQVKKENITAPENLEEQALSLVGRDIYEKLIRGYTEKQWGKKATELPPEIIKRIPVRFTFDNNYFNDKYQGIPEGGYTELCEKLLEGCDVMTECDFFRERDALMKKAKKTVYSGMIDEYFGFSLGHLEYRSLRFETQILDTPDFQGRAVVNYTDSDVPYTRIIEHKHFEGTVSARTVITREFPDAVNVGKEPFYPVNDEKNNELYKGYLELAKKEKNVIFGGRLGTYKYLDMDDVIAMALELARAQVEK